MLRRLAMQNQRELLSRYWLVQLEHTLREANGVTDHLAKKGAQGTLSYGPQRLQGMCHFGSKMIFGQDRIADARASPNFFTAKCTAQ
ncbi:unnamed protein product [Lupinus luteus]|uniref:RNase H type-1 domain-containing protein n=1 Tax=Lupinus luteus TaxID=3873 RepID=A0AAV1WFM5_LUPLU